ncbi:hypothetical protein F9C28_14600 [Shimwellia pseudoproteus]|uniref:hypothetical protein n=1 Tax=Shimwellia pseudoproteus TaxID=570012 RepID=UPI0018ED18FE|nr:hypothetical protein [Shimwellia pseudoproteus]MBJ3816125.1 hypothetical protein [Shimwellia pseudoproteus]
MAVHITLRCITGGEVYNQTSGTVGCDGNSLNIVAEGTRQSVLESAERLFSLAHQAGWRHCPQGWVCPDCSRQGAEDRPVEQAPLRRIRCRLPVMPVALTTALMFGKYAGLGPDAVIVRRPRLK